MVVDFSKLDLREPPTLILKNTTGTPIGVLGYAMHISADIKYDETSVIEFELPAWVDGKPTPHYDAVIGMRVVDLQDVGQFILVNPKETGDGVKKIKACKGYSLEYEFTFKKLSLSSATYNFWNPVTPDSTLLGIILEMMPSWHVGSIDSALVGKYRTFEVSDENLYNFIKGTAQNSYNCIFDFDTYNRRINVKDASSTVATNPVYISNTNLAKEISVEENTENIVTRLDVNGAEGVNIRDVNPSGSNQIVNLDYFMNTDNFTQALIDKYYAWKESYENYQLPYYNLSVEYALQIMRKTTEQAALVELESERTVLENEQAVIIQGIARDLKPQSDLDDVNTRLATKQEEINAKAAEIKEIEAQAAEIYSELVTINKATNFQSYFTAEEYLQIDRYLKDDAVSESSFVAQTTDSYQDDDAGNAISEKTIAVSGASITFVTNTRDKDIYDIKGGRITADFIDAEIISAAFEKSPNDSFVMTAYLGAGTAGERTFPKGCISLTGTVSAVSSDMATDEEVGGLKTGTELNITIAEGYLYFTMNTSEYEKRAVAWDLFEYGREILEKISQPSYTFSITGANFLCLDDFVKFKNQLKHGQKIYVGIGEDETLSPICVGVKFSYDDLTELTLEFSDTYISGDSSFLLADLLEQSVSMGKNVELSKYTYSAFMDSGASTKVKDFMSAALDVSKNAIMSSKEQAISWGDSGIRLRKWANDLRTEYDPKQVWLNNNSILMTSDNWSTAELAIGNFYDENLGDCWGVVAPNIVGTLLAGSNLVIESAKEDGGVAVFKVDAEGCTLHNSNFSITNEDTNTHILLDPMHGMMIGKYPLIDNEGVVDDTKKLFYADTDGNLTLKGTIYASAGEFTGKITALEGYIGDVLEGWTIISNAIYSGKPTFSSQDEGIYIGTDGISLGDASNYIRANKNGFLLANNIEATGKITATSGYIGDGERGWRIASTAIYNGKPALDSEDNGIYIGVDGISISHGGNFIRLDGGTGSLTANSATITGTINANDGYFSGELRAATGSFSGEVTATSGNIGGCLIENGKLQISSAEIGDISASQIKGGTLDCSQITVSSLSADSITSGTINADTISVNNLHAGNLKGGGNYGYVTSGAISDADHYLSDIYATNGSFVNLFSSYLTMNYSIKLNSGETTVATISSSGISFGGTNYTWAQVLSGATGDVTPKFG